jgi:hypothetical protein
MSISTSCGPGLRRSINSGASGACAKAAPYAGISNMASTSSIFGVASDFTSSSFLIRYYFFAIVQGRTLSKLHSTYSVLAMPQFLHRFVVEVA